MKSLILTLILTICFSHRNFSQVEKVEFELEKTPFKMSLNSGVYKSRLSGLLIEKIVLEIFQFLPKFTFLLKDL